MNTTVSETTVPSIDTRGMSPAQLGLLTSQLLRREIDFHDAPKVAETFGTLVGNEILDACMREFDQVRRAQVRASTTEIRTDKQLNLLASLLTSPAAKDPRMAKAVNKATDVIVDADEATIFSVSSAIDSFRRMALIFELDTRPARWITTYRPRNNAPESDLTLTIEQAAQDLGEESFAD